MRRSPRAEVLERRILLADVPDGFTDSEVARDLQSPTAMEIAPDGRLFVAGQEGKLYIVDDGEVMNPLTIPNVRSGGERGFVGITLDPNFSSNGHVFVYYTRNAGETLRHNRIARYTFQGNSVVGGETVIFDLTDTKGSTIHMGGALHFGPDGKLYVAVGDHLQSQESPSLDSLFGKILRINADGSIPSDNPFFNQTSGKNRAIWARGFRNPFTFNFQPGTERMHINDVGQDAFEEINRGAAGANYGWPSTEGPTSQPGITPPIFWYNRSASRCAITGSIFYNPPSPTFPSHYVGKYYFSDLCAGDIRMLDVSDNSVDGFATGLSFAVDLDIGPDGSMYYLARGTDINSGHIGKISFAADDGAPAINQQPRNASARAGESVTFSVVATGSGTLSYQWQHDGEDIAGANASSLTIQSVQPSDEGSYRVIVSNNAGFITSSAATLSVVSGNAPQATITSPAAGTRFRGGQTFMFSGGATDTEDGTLGADRLRWRIDYHTGNVVRPFVPQMTGVASGTFTIPTETAYKATDVFYRVRLTATDSDGTATTVTRDIQPVTATITLRTNLPGADLFLDGQPQDPPTSTAGVAGVKRLLGAPALLHLDGINYVFDGWSDGGDREHTILTPDAAVTYEARFRAVGNKSTKGLAATYFNNRDRTGTVITTNVSTIDFDFAGGSPDPLVHRDTFFIRFRGKVQPQFTETYTFHAVADDGVRLFVNGELLIDQWNDSDGTELTGTIDLEAGRKYDLRFDYFENIGDAKAQLFWSSPSVQKQIIPRNRLFSALQPRTLAPTADAFVQGGTSANTNFGESDRLLAKSSNAQRLQRLSYIKFNIGDVDPDSIESAKLRLFGRLSSDANLSANTGLFHAPAAKWSETSITFANRPAVEPGAIATARVSDSVDQWWEFDVTKYLRRQRVLGRSIVTFVLQNDISSTALAEFNSRNALTSLPQLQVFS